eukprot:g33187.t1
MAHLPKYEIQVKNTFLDFREPQDLFRRQTSWSPGDVASPSAGGVERLVPPTPASPKQGRPDAARSCNPCVYFASSYGCTAEACSFCHFPVCGSLLRKRPRPRKSVRETYKGILDVLFIQKEDGVTRRGQLQALAEEEPYVRSLIIGRLDAEFFSGQL